MFMGAGIIGGGGSAADVQLPALNLANYEFSGPVHSGVQFASDGKINIMNDSGAWQYSGHDWLLAGASSSFYIVRTLNGPDSLNELDSGTLQQMNSNNGYALSSSFSEKESDVTISISNDASGLPLLVTRTYALYAEVFDFE